MYKYLFFLLLLNNTVEAQKPKNDIIERSGLGNFVWKLKHNTNDTLNIAFFGGSITQAENGWRDKTFSWLQHQYPHNKFKQINAALGGTGSSLGVYRLNDQVLKYKPDLLFVEFAVNDFDFSRTNILTSMEGIVRKTFAANGKTDICFVYTITENMYRLYNNDSVPGSIQTMEEVARYYNIPSINLGLNIVRLANEKTLFIKGSQPFSNDSCFFSNDGVHPYSETGHQQYFKTISTALNQLFAKEIVSKHVKVKPYYSDGLQNSTIMDVQPYMLKGNVESIKKFPEDIAQKFIANMPNTYLLSDTIQQIAFSFTGNQIGFMDVLAPSSAQIVVYIDKDAPRYINRFDKYCFYFSRVHWFFIDGLTNGKHHISIKIAAKQPDKFLLLEEGKEKSALDKPEEFGKHIWRVGKILVNEKLQQ